MRNVDLGGKEQEERTRDSTIVFYVKKQPLGRWFHADISKDKGVVNFYIS